MKTYEEFLFVSGEENSPGWLCGEDEGKIVTQLCCPLLACHLPVFAMKSPKRKVALPPILDDSDFFFFSKSLHEVCHIYRRQNTYSAFMFSLLCCSLMLQLFKFSFFHINLHY